MNAVDAALADTTPTHATSARAGVRIPDTRLLIDGEWCDAADGRSFAVVDPSTEHTIAQVARADAADVDRAVAAARRAFEGPWARVSPTARARLLWRIAELIDAELQALAALEALDVGKPISGASREVPMAAETFRHYAGWADRIGGHTFDLPDFMGRRRFSYTVRRPVGVVGAIIPWNSPTMIAAWKLAPALAAGCTVVLKPAEDAPLAVLRLAELAQEAGVPAGVLNVVPGFGAEAGAALVRHDDVDKVSFTGSPEVGREIARVAGPSFRRVTLELGGKSPQIFAPDADLERALPGAVLSLFANQGQTCAAGTRVLAHRSILDDVVGGLAEQAAALPVGDPFDEHTRMGSLINQSQLERVMGYIERGVSEQAELVVGGGRVERPGFYMEPTIFRGSNDMTIAREEIFGPVGTVIAFDDLDEAWRLANATDYGLTAVVWTSSLATAHSAIDALRVGAVWVNAWGPPDPRLPWGGTKTSGIGRELGEAGIAACTEEMAVSIIP